MERITNNDLSRVADSISYYMIKAASIAYNDECFVSRSDVQRGGRVNGNHWRFSVQIFRSNSIIAGHALVARSARELHSKMDAFEDALRAVSNMAHSARMEQNRARR